MSSSFMASQVLASPALETSEVPVCQMNPAGSREPVEGLVHWSPGGLCGVIASWLLPWLERHHAARASANLLALYRTVKADHPDWVDRELYKLVVMARAGRDSTAAAAILKCAEKRFADRPTRRASTLCDVVHYLSVTEFLSTHACEAGICSNIARAVATHIPRDLCTIRARN